MMMYNYEWYWKEKGDLFKISFKEKKINIYIYIGKTTNTENLHLIFASVSETEGRTNDDPVFHTINQNLKVAKARIDGTANESSRNATSEVPRYIRGRQLTVKVLLPLSLFLSLSPPSPHYRAHGRSLASLSLSLLLLSLLPRSSGSGATLSGPDWN